jgi:serine protease Do
MNAVKQLQDKGRVTRGRIGVQIQEVNKETADAFGLAKTGGALVNSVEKGGPADKAGIESGDIIVKADGRTVNPSSELPRIITQIKPRTRIPVQVGERRAKDVTITVAEPGRRGAEGRACAEQKSQTERMGPVLSTSPTIRRTEVKNGVLIETSAAVRGNIRPAT